MRSRFTARVLGLAALLPLLALAVSGPGYDRFRCAFTGEVSEASCCPAHETPATPVANAASCCDHESARPVSVPAEDAAAPRATAPQIAAVAPAIFAPPVVAIAPSSRTPGRAPPRPPLVLLKQSFLI